MHFAYLIQSKWLFIWATFTHKVTVMLRTVEGWGWLGVKASVLMIHASYSGISTLLV